MINLPPLFPRPPFLEVDEEENGEETAETVDEASFRKEMKTEGFNEELIEMGVKVAKNHLKTKEEAYRIGENYIREMNR